MADPFITTDDLSDYLGRDVTSDNGAIIALDAACDVCRDLAETDFNAGSATVTFDGTGTDAIVLPNRPIIEVVTVTVNGAAITDFFVNPDAGLLLRGTTGGGLRPVWPVGRQNVAVTYSFGYDPADVPRSVKMIALSIAARYVVQGVAKRESIGDASVDYAVAAGDLTVFETKVLRRYRRARSF